MWLVKRHISVQSVDHKTAITHKLLCTLRKSAKSMSKAEVLLSQQHPDMDTSRDTRRAGQRCKVHLVIYQVRRSRQ